MRLSASLHAADPLHLAQAAAAVAPHVASLHVDVMDGRFAPAFGFGERLVEYLLAGDTAPVDVHLMVEEPEAWAVRFAALGARRVAFHAEATRDVRGAAGGIRAVGSLAYLALLPQTPIAAVADLLSGVDGVLLLTAPPGGGVFDPAALARVHQLPPGLSAIVDGHLELAHFKTLRAAGVDLAVIGRALFDGDGLAARAQAFDRAASSDGAATQLAPRRTSTSSGMA